MTSHRLLVTALLTALVGPSAASAQLPGSPPPAAPAAKPAAAPLSDYVPNTKVSLLADKPQGWSYGVTLGANLNVAGNRDVVGQVDGRSLLFGASVLSSIGYLNGPHEWLNKGTLTETWSKTPTIDRFVKANDVLSLESLYNYFLNEFTGPFARLSVQTSILKTDRVTPTAVNYVNKDDATDTKRSSHLRLSDGFQPFTLTESLGWFVQPIHSERMTVFGRTGLGGRHTWADGALAIADATANPATFAVLRDVHQAGAEIFIGIDGKEVGGKLVYSVGANTLFPVVNNDDQNRSVLKLTKIALAATAGIGVFSWMSLNYQLKVVHDVQLVDAVQVQNAMLLSFQYALSSPVPGAPPAKLAPEVEERIAKLEARAKAAELRAAEAESKGAPAAVLPTEGAVDAPLPEAAPAPAALPAAVVPVVSGTVALPPTAPVAPARAPN